MGRRQRVTKRLTGGAMLLGLLLGGAACNAGQQPTAAGVAPQPDVSADHSGHTARPAASPRPLRADERFVTVSMPEPYTPAAPNGGTDEYRCFLVDPKLTESAFLTGSQFLPQNAEIVHHAIFFRLAPAQVPAAEAADAGTPGQGWTCFGNAGISDDAAWVAHWAPGSDETLLSPTIGYPMPAGSRLVMQVHYNLLGAQGKPAGSDKSGIRLRLSSRAGLTPLETDLLPAPVELPCATGETGPLCDREAAIRDVAHRFGESADGTVIGLNQRCNPGRTPIAGPVQHCDHPVPSDATIYAVAGHMHLLGRAIKIELNPGRPAARTLLNVTNYNFDEQAIIPLAKPVRVTTGDILRVTCRHDATLRQKLPQLRTTPPRYVVWGEGTSDEMCLGLIIWSRT